MNPRIAYLVSRYPSISHSFILREVLALRRRGFEIHTASINPPDRPPESLTAEERAEAEATFCIKSVSSPNIAGTLCLAAIASPLRLARSTVYALGLAKTDLRAAAFNLFYLVEAILLAAWMRRLKITHVHVHFATPAATVAMIASRFAGIDFSLTVHGPDEFYNVDRYYLEEKVRLAKFICCISNFCRSQMMKLCDPSQWSKFEVSPLGIDPDLFCPGECRRSSEWRMLCVGRLVPAKGQAVLLHALKRLLDRGPDVTLTLVGDGPDRVGLESLASSLGLNDRVTFAGAVNQDSIRHFYRSADVFVLPSFAEGVPVVLMEAMAMGIPCVSTAIAGIPELITSGADGILVPASDPDLLTEAIALLMNSERLGGELSQRGRKKVASHYNLETNVDRLASIFQRRIAGSLPASMPQEVIA